MTVPRLAQLLRTTLALEKIDLLKKVNSGEEKRLIHYPSQPASKKSTLLFTLVPHWDLLVFFHWENRV